MALTLVDFQWKVSVAEAYGSQEETMTEYFGWYYAVVNLFTGGIQFFLAGRILRRYGVASALVLLPASVFCGTSMILAASAQRIGLAAATVLKGTECFKRGINDPALQLMFKALPDAQRRAAITMTHGIAKPIAEIVAAVSLQAVVLVLTPHDISWLLLALIVGWGYIVYGAHSALSENTSN